jgi:hypothetical protein
VRHGYRSAGRFRGRQSGQAGGLRVKTGKVQNQGDEKKRDWENYGAETKALVDLTNKTKWQQTNREHR